MISEGHVIAGTTKMSRYLIGMNSMLQSTRDEGRLRDYRPTAAGRNRGHPSSHLYSQLPPGNYLYLNAESTHLLEVAEFSHLLTEPQGLPTVMSQAGVLWYFCAVLKLYCDPCLVYVPIWTVACWFETDVCGVKVQIRGGKLRLPWIVELCVFDIRTSAQQVFTFAIFSKVIYIRHSQTELPPADTKIDPTIRFSILLVSRTN
jgi:hypothetical protein